ncbi:MAG: sugar phosphate isomerase/epimerase [Planctomycetes bacterium]|nr:sugar phosphate isomerase/epimerase [Planctomycetota bacterium]
MSCKIAAQMFTLRDFTKTGKDLAETLKKVAEIGYPAVQMSAVGCMNGETPEISAKEAKKMLDDNGLKCIATHRNWDNLMNSIDAEIEFHKNLGCDFAAIGGIPGDKYPGAEGTRKWLADAATVIEKLKSAGIRFGHHNHSHEFKRIDDPRGCVENILIEEGPKDLLFEFDLYWIEHAGFNCARIIERCHGRMPIIHLKDKEVAEKNETRMAPIGEGNMDWPHIFPACDKAGVEWYCVEQDQTFRDPFDCMKSSFDYMKSMGL